MRPIIRVNQLSAAATNRRLVVQLLRRTPMSRRQLAIQTGLQNSSVTNIVRELLDAGIIRAIGKAASNGASKKQEMLEVNPDVGWVVGAGVEGDHCSLVVVDASGRKIDRDRFPLREPARLLPQVLRARLDAWIARHGRPGGKLLGVGVGVPGIVDEAAGIVLRSTRLQVADWPLGALLREVFDASPHVDNDSNFAVLAESRTGEMPGAANILYYLMNAQEHGAGYQISSLGSAMCLGGQLYRGSHYSAGEIDTLLDTVPHDTVTAENLLLIAQPDGEFSASLQAVATHLARRLVPLVDLIDPSIVVLGGNLCIANRQMLTFLHKALNAQILQVPRRQVCVQPSMFMDYGVAMGGAIAALDRALYAPPGEFVDEAFPALAGDHAQSP